MTRIPRPAAQAGWRVLSWARGHAYRGTEHRLVSWLPGRVRRHYRILAPRAGDRRVEIGSGYSPRPGYIHVDAVAWNGAIDLVAPADALPLPPAWADEILAVHMIEHLAPASLAGTLRHWFDLLVPGGVLTVHTPDGAALGRSLADSSGHVTAGYWPAISALFGYNRHPADVPGPSALTEHPDHRMVFTEAVLSGLLSDAGFIDVINISGQDPQCHHTIDWAPFVPGLCLEVRAHKPAAA